METNYIYTLVRTRSGKQYGDSFDTLETAREAFNAYNAERDAIKRRNHRRQVAYSDAVDTARKTGNKTVANLLAKAGYRRERVPAELTLIGTLITANA